MKKKHVAVTNARPGTGYLEVLKKIENHGVCPFCSEHLATYHPNPILEERKHWKITNSAFPYKPARVHLLLIHKEHIEHIDELSEEAWNELHVIIVEQTKRLGIAGGTFLLRFGDTTFTGGSVTHLHAHLVQSDPSDPTYTDKKAVTGLAARIG